MSTPFREFARVFEEFQERYPKHPLVEELRNQLSKGKFPSESWLKSKTSKMNSLICPPWSHSLRDEDRELAS
jgi:hypothetical protein